MLYLLIGLFSLAHSNDVFSIRCLLCLFAGFFVIKSYFFLPRGFFPLL